MIKNINKLINEEYIFEIKANYVLIKQGSLLKLNKKPFNIAYLDKMIDYFPNCEMYRECALILKLKNKLLITENNYSDISNK